MECPNPPASPKEQPLTHRYTITLPKNLIDEIERYKQDHGVRAVNTWLRSLWVYGIEQDKNTNLSDVG